VPVSGRNSSMQAAGTAKAFERKLGLPEALGLSLSIVGPSMAMAFNVSLAVRAAGRAAPLAFAIATIALGMVALAFVRFSRRLAHAGSAYAFGRSRPAADAAHDERSSDRPAALI